MSKHSTLTIYVEGGNRNSRASLIACQAAFKKLLERAGLPPRGFRVVAGASRRQAYDDFCYALAREENALLLVDSEDPVAISRAANRPLPAWQHLAGRPNDALPPPEQATAGQAHLMVPTMEAWLLASRPQLAAYYRGQYGRGAFNERALPARDDVEQLTKAEINQALENATRPNQAKGIYHKGRHSFEILEALDPQAIVQRSYHFRRLLCHLRAVLQATITWLDCAEFPA